MLNMIKIHNGGTQSSYTLDKHNVFGHKPILKKDMNQTKNGEKWRKMEKMEIERLLLSIE